MKKKLVLLLSIGFIFYLSCSPKEASNNQDKEQTIETTKISKWVGEKALSFSLKEASTSEKINLDQLIGKKVIYITWWATWCQACKEEIPELTRLYSKFKDKGLEIVSINVEESQAKVAKYVKRKGVPYINVLDLDGSVSKLYKVVGIPINVVIDKNGIIQYYGSKIPPDSEELISKLTAELQLDNSETIPENVQDSNAKVNEDSRIDNSSRKTENNQVKTANFKQNSAQFKKAPSFTLKDIYGKEVSLSSYKNKVILLNFWATWCPPCRMELPHLKDISKEYGDKNLQVIGISVDQAKVDVVKKYAEKNKINFPILMAESKVIYAYNGTANISIPRTFIIDKEMNIREMIVGYREKKDFESKFIMLLD